MSLASDKAAYLAGEMTTDEYTQRNAAEIAANRARHIASDPPVLTGVVTRATKPQVHLGKVFAVMVGIAILLAYFGTRINHEYAKPYNCRIVGTTIVNAANPGNACDMSRNPNFVP